MLRFYWNLGRDIASMVNYAGYGTKFYKKLGTDLQKELPDVKSFSVINLKYMKYFYEMYYRDGNRQQVVDDFDDRLNRQSVDERIFHIPWEDHIQILNKCKDNQEKALFFVKKVIENNWSRAVLMNFLDTNLYERQGKAISNFDKILPDAQSDLAQEMTKDPYNFDFLTLRQDYDEKELKDALMENVQSFLLELEKGFAYMQDKRQCT